jgi:hypothetical protein
MEPMPMWKLLLAASAIALALGMLRRMRMRFLAPAVESIPEGGSGQVTGRGVALRAAGGLELWIPRGKPLPTECRRLLRVRSADRPELSLRFELEGEGATPLFEVRVGELESPAHKVRLLDVCLRVQADGAAEVRAFDRGRRVYQPVTVQGLPGAGGGGGNARVPVEARAGS